MVMNKTIIFIFTFFLAISSFAQSGSKVAHTIIGKVVNAESNRPVSYTNIGLEGTFFGTASDADGNFELKIPEDFVDKDIYFSAVGFKNKQFAVEKLFSKSFNVIKLESKSYGVGPVDVAAQNMVLIRILRMASENIKYNYGAGPFNMHFDYMAEKKVDGANQNTKKASVLLYDGAGYSNPSKADAFKSRKYSVNEVENGEFYRFAEASLNLDELLELDWVRSAGLVLNPALLSEYKLTLESQPTIDGKEYWVIAFSQQVPTIEASGDFYATAFSGKITINKEDYSVLKIEGEVQSEKNNRQGRGLAVGESNAEFYSDVNYSFVVDYKDLLLKDITLDKTYRYKGKAISEKWEMDMTRAHTNNLTVIDNRNYFAGE